jgi:hypothetical protein
MRGIRDPARHDLHFALEDTEVHGHRWVCDTAHTAAASSAIPAGAKLNTEKIMGKHVSQSTRTVKDKLDNRLPKERKHRVERRGIGYPA